MIIHYTLFTFENINTADVLAEYCWNHVAQWGAAVYLERSTRQLFGPRIANRALLLLAVFPSSFFFTVIYSEATCILFISAALYYLETRRVLLAGGLGFLAGLSRPEGFLVAIPFLVKVFLEDQKVRKLIAGFTVLA